MKINLNGAEFEFDIYDTKTAKKYSKGLLDIQAKCANVEKCTDASKQIVAQCNIVFAFLDSLFGKGVAKKIFGESVSFTKCMDILEEIIESAEQQAKAMAERKVRYGQKIGTVKNDEHTDR